MNMAVFSNPVVQYEKFSNIKVAGINSKWNRPIVISDSGITEKILMPSVGALIPSGAPSTEVDDIKYLLESKDVKVSHFIESAIGVIEYYKRQKAINYSEKELIIVEVNQYFTDLCHVKCEADKYLINSRLRVDYGIDFVARCLAELPRYKNLSVYFEELLTVIQSEILRSQLPREKVMMGTKQQNTMLKRQDFVGCIRKFLKIIMVNIDAMMFRENIGKSVLLLSGKLWVCPEAVQMMKDRYIGKKIVSYKPETAALLGGVYYSQQHHPMQALCLIDSNYSTLHCKDVWGKVNKLNQHQKQGYWKLLEAILKKEKEVLLKGNIQDLSAIYNALCVDYPETDILLSYTKSTCYLVGTSSDPFIKFIPSFKENGAKLMKKIDKKAESILKSIVFDRKQYSDYEIIEMIYWHISRHYHYTKEKTSAGEFPDYTYTLETLLRCGVCHGYAISMIYILKKLQIPIFYVGGDADGRAFGGHAWNLISTIDGEYRHLDITWDLERACNNEAMKYFLLDDIGMKARKHFWNQQEYPMCI